MKELKSAGSALSARSTPIVISGEGVNNNDNVSKVVNDYDGGSKKKKLIGIHFETDIADKLNEINTKGSKGVQSRFVNDAVRKLMQERGLL